MRTRYPLPTTRHPPPATLLSVIGLLLTALFGGITAVVELLAIPWTSFFGVTAVCLITGGVLLLVNGLRPARE